MAGKRKYLGSKARKELEALLLEMASNPVLNIVFRERVRGEFFRLKDEYEARGYNVNGYQRRFEELRAIAYNNRHS